MTIRRTHPDSFFLCLLSWRWWTDPEHRFEKVLVTSINVAMWLFVLYLWGWCR